MFSVINGQRRGRRALAVERGQALVEFALVLPLILLLVLGMIDVGKAISYWNDETHLANEAVRYIAVNNSGDPNWAGNKTNPAYKINTWIRGEAETNELKNGGGSIAGTGMTVAICFPNVTHNAGDPVQVTITATYNWLQYFAGGLGPGITLTGKATMRIEQAPTDPTNPASPDAYTASATC